MPIPIQHAVLSLFAVIAVYLWLFVVPGESLCFCLVCCQSEDAGSYMCVATNDAGVVERSVTLTLQSKMTTHNSDWHQV